MAATHANEEDDDEAPRYLHRERAGADGEGARGEAQYTECDRLVRSIELGACGSSALGFSEEPSRFPEGQRLLAWG